MTLSACNSGRKVDLRTPRDLSRYFRDYVAASTEVRYAGGYGRHLNKRGGTPGAKTTCYFEEQVLRKRPYLRREWCERVLARPLRREVQPDGRIRPWGIIPEPGNRVLRVVTLVDGETVHNAFPDRNFAVPTGPALEDI